MSEPVMVSVCCDAEVSSGTEYEPFVYRCIACGREMNLWLHHNGVPQMHYKQ